MRLFVSLPIPEEVRGHLASALRELGQVKQPALEDVRWVRPENLHMTLKFLGEVFETDLPRIRAALGSVSGAGPLLMRAERICVEPRSGPVHLVATDISGDSVGIRRLQESVALAMEELCFGQESRGFWPHVTLGRSQKGISFGRSVPVDTSLADLSKAAWPGAEGRMERFELVSSSLTPEGPVYETIQTFPLATPPNP